MSVIQNIRDKYAKWAVVAIALALLGFILTDYFNSSSRVFGNSSTTLGRVNGKRIDAVEFEKKLKAIDDQAKAQAESQGRAYSENEQYQNRESLWNQEVDQIIMNGEFEKLGLSVGKKEITDWFYGSNPPSQLAQSFTNQAGQYDAAAAQQQINSMKRSPDQAIRNQLNSFIGAMEYTRMEEKYKSLLTHSSYLPKWFIEKQNTENSGLAKASFFMYPYTKIADSTIKISDKEIEDYISKHKDVYKQEESRSISYVLFSAAPSAADTASIKSQVGDLKSEFEKVAEPTAFLARNGSAMEFYDGYTAKSKIQVPAKDSIFALSKNAVLGPYLDGGSFVLAKMIDVKTLPDSVKCRHVLVGTNPSQGGVEDSIGAKQIDSIKNAISGGASWADMVQKYNPQSDGSRQKNGEMEFSSSEIQGPNFAKEFAQFILFDGKKGERKVVKTSFGYHYIEIMDQKNPQLHYKVAYFAKRITTSDETDRMALGEASKFASDSRNLKTFDENFEKTLKTKGYQKLTAQYIMPTANAVMGIPGTSRQLVKQIYSAGKGDVLPQERVGDQYVVVAVTGIFEEGIQDAATARPGVEPMLRNKKKAEQIKQKLGKISTLESAHTALRDTTILITTADSIRFGAAVGINDPKVLGAVFNPANKGKTVPEAIEGVGGVFVVKVEDVTTTALAAADIEGQRAAYRKQKTQPPMFSFGPPPNPYLTTLKKNASVKDNRKKFF